MTEVVDIVHIIEKNPITKLTKTYENRLIEKIKKEFTEQEQQLFIGSFYGYLNYNTKTDYVIDLDNVWKWIGFFRKEECKRVLTKHFIEDKDYLKKAAPQVSGAGPNIKLGKNLGGSGQNKEQILMSINTFKKLCLKSRTDKADEIHDYYIKLEEVFHEIVNEETQEMREQLENKSKEVELKQQLLEEKDKCISELKNLEVIDVLYIGYNPVIKNLMKIGITTNTKKNDILVRRENHNSSNPGFDYLFTYETPNAKSIEDLVKLFLKPYKVQKPEWFRINYEKMKKIVDFCILVFDEYKVYESEDNLVEFVSRYRSNRLVNTNRARVMIDYDIYTRYIKENLIYGEKLKVSTEILSRDFYNWYSEEYPELLEKTHIKLETGNWSTAFQRELTKTLESITDNRYTRNITLTDKKRGIYFSKSAGFLGFEVRNMNTGKFFDDKVYDLYANENISVTNNDLNKVSRAEILDDFLAWVKNNDIKSEMNIYCQSAISSVFRQILIEKLSQITGCMFDEGKELLLEYYISLQII